MAHKISDKGNARAKTPRTPSSELTFFLAVFAGFARDDPTFGYGSAALGTLNLRGDAFFPSQYVFTYSAVLSNQLARSASALGL
jgi:hypothetical protein